MRRRDELSGFVLLSTVWAWLVLVLACGAVAPRYQKQLSDVPADACCAHGVTNDPCATPSCALTCAALFTVALSEDRVALTAHEIGAEFLRWDEIGRVNPRQPPVPPPREWV